MARRFLTYNCMKFLRSNYYLVAFIGIVAIFFAPFLSGKLPIPADSLVGLYHPWRDTLRSNYPNGYPYKNPLITDPVRQQYPYRFAAISELKAGRLPQWNPYSFSGTPLLANLQAAVFYPLNIIFWLTSFQTAWALLVMLQPLLAGMFLYFYLRNFDLSSRASFLGALSFSFSGFFVAWMEWNTIGHVAAWFPLVLLAKEKLLRKISLPWVITLIFAESTLIFSGHAQTAFYAIGFSTMYLLVRILQIAHEQVKAGSKNYSQQLLKNFLIKLQPFLLFGILVIIITSIQTVPSLKFILSSARNFDLPDWHRPDWFLPWQHLIQFVAPDFFGNPTTGNYWGVWNYGEFVGYIALFPLLMAFFAITARRDRKTLFFTVMLVISVLLALPTAFAKLPYELNIPFLSTLQPSRIIFLIDFCLSVLAALGLDYVVRPEEKRNRRVLRVIMFISISIVGLWLVVLFGAQLGLSYILIDTIVARRNLAFPTAFFVISSIGLLGFSRFAFKKIILTRISIIILLGITIFDFYRFFTKFTPFTDPSLLFPTTKTTEFLQSNTGNFRVMSADRRILAPNTTLMYGIQSVDGYDPLYLQNYGELIASWTRNRADISPAAFNRILTPENSQSLFTNLLGVKYVLSLNPLELPGLVLVFQEGETRVYENKNVLPRVYLAEAVSVQNSPAEVVKQLFANENLLDRFVFTYVPVSVEPFVLENEERAEISNYTANEITINVQAKHSRLLVLTDLYYPAWRAYVDEIEAKIIPANYFFRGVVVPIGNHTVTFRI